MPKEFLLLGFTSLLISLVTSYEVTISQVRPALLVSKAYERVPSEEGRSKPPN